MFSLAGRTWSEAIARICGISPAVLPPVADPGTAVGAVTAAAAVQTGLRAGTPVLNCDFLAATGSACSGQRTPD